MTTPDETPDNVAKDSSTVGVQAHAVLGNVTIYQLPERATAEQKYQLGVNFLDGGMPGKAHDCIADAIAEGYETNAVVFYRLLALMSGRTIRQFSEEEKSTLSAIRRQELPGPCDEWADGVRVIFRLLDSADAPDADGQLAIKKFDELGQLQKGRILRHLELFLAGNLEDLLWERELKRVRDEQMAADRKDRVWMFFQAIPAEPRVRPVAPRDTPLGWWLLAIVAAPVFVTAVGAIGWELLIRGTGWAAAAYFLSVAGGCLCAVTGLRWRSATERRDAREKVFRARWPKVPGSPDDKDRFARQVDELFSDYFRRYVPDSTRRDHWLAETAGIRRYLSDELIAAYENRGVSAEEVRWLIRHRVAQVKRLWGRDGLAGYRLQFRPGPAVKKGFAVGLMALALGGFVALGNAALTAPLIALPATAMATLSGVGAVASWLRILLERRRYAADMKENAQLLKDGQEAYERWSKKLEPRPKDWEVAAWLDCDRKILIDRAMRQYGLSPSRVITHAVLEAPAKGYRKRARVLNGPWRYMRYHLLVFLLTDDGVRQVSADLALAEGTFHDWERTNYRFDAVAAVRVLQPDNYERIFQLGLVNGRNITIRVTPGEDEEQLQQGEDAEALNRAAMEAAGLTNTLNFLEGVAAEGKRWLQDEIRRNRRRKRPPDQEEPG
jgi:hypothetical protein